MIKILNILKNILYTSNEDIEFTCKCFSDVGVDWQKGFQDPATSVAEGIISLHHEIFFFLIVILFLVSWMLIKIIKYFSYQYNKAWFPLFQIMDKNNVDHNLNLLFKNQQIAFFLLKFFKSEKIIHNAILEIIWVIIPAIILICIAIPSFDILYSMDEIFNPEFLIKIIGNQWYWSYEVPQYLFSNKLLIKNTTYDSFIIQNDDPFKKPNFCQGTFRLLETDVWVCLPIKTHLQAILTSEDVIHSWAVPSLGVKVDCVPGRLNQTSIFIKRAGLFYGQCSEICGINHGFMPIKISAFSPIQWTIKNLLEVSYLKLGKLFTLVNTQKI